MKKTKSSRYLIILSLLAIIPLLMASACSSSTSASAGLASAKGTLGSKQVEELTVNLLSSPNPPVQGNNTFEVLVTDGNGQPIADATISFDLDMTNMNMGKNVVTATSQGDGYYNGKVYFSMSGPWRAIVSVATAGKIDTARFDFNVNRR